MQTHSVKRIEIIIEAPMQRRLTKTLDDMGVPGYTVLPVLGGSGQSGPWTRDGQVSAAGGMIAVILLIADDGVEALLEAVHAVLDRHIGVVSITQAQVIRKERFEPQS